jgi:mRNA-degrading endonuclease RelE of RelBE toxin-antitoxin system
LTSKTTARFKQALARLPRQVQILAYQKYEIWSKDPRHPSLRFKLLTGQKDLWSVRIGDHYRALGSFQGPELFVWTWIGTHEEYNRLIKR